MAEPTRSSAAPASAPSGKMLGLRTALIAAAVFETVEALWDLPILFRGMDTFFGEASGSGLAEAITKAQLASHPALALAALGFAATGRVRYAIIALGAVVITAWLSHLPWLGRLDLSKGWDVQWATKQIIAFPLMAAFAIMLAARDRRPGLATALVSIPSLNNAFTITVFAIGVVINGL
jgi:hypothetical protein